MTGRKPNSNPKDYELEERIAILIEGGMIEEYAIAQAKKEIAVRKPLKD